MSGVPANIIIPFMGIDFDSSRASPGPALVPVNMLVIGQRLSTGTVAAETAFLATTAEEVALKGGRGSMLHRMAIKAFLNNTTVPITFIGLDDAATATAATHAFTISGTATAVGEYVRYVAGERIAVSVAVGDTATDVGDAWAAACNLKTNLQVTAANAAGTVTLTCRNAGLTAAADLDTRLNYNSGEQLPAGIADTDTITVTPGTVDPDITDALAVVGDSWYNVIAQPWTDATNMGILQTFLDAQNGVMVMKDSMSYQAKRDTLANMITWGTTVATYNNEWCSSLPAYKRMESTYELAAGVAGAVAVSVQDDPAVPLHRIQLVGFSVQHPDDRWTPTERNSLALAGVATFTDERGVQTESMVTMYLQNSAGGADTAYQQQNTLFQLSAARYRFRNQILLKYPRAKLADSADNLGPGQQIMTPDIGKAEAVTWFKQGQRDGLFDSSSAALTQFMDEVQVTRDATNLNRLNWSLPPDMMNQFIVGSATIQFLG